jgi:hypothetical protein
MVSSSRPLKGILGIAVVAVSILSLWLVAPYFVQGPSMDQDLDDPEVTILLSGTLQEVDTGHKGSGTVQLAQSSAGNQSIFFIDVTITNGPDLYVYLSKVNSFSGVRSDPGEFVSLGIVPAAEGTFSVALPDTMDGSEYASVLIWCQAFSVLFTYAILE